MCGEGGSSCEGGAFTVELSANEVNVPFFQTTRINAENTPGWPAEPIILWHRGGQGWAIQAGYALSCPWNGPLSHRHFHGRRPARTRASAWLNLTSRISATRGLAAVKEQLGSADPALLVLPTCALSPNGKQCSAQPTVHLGPKYRWV